MAFTSEVALLRPGSRITARFLAWSLRSPELHRELLGDPDDPRFRHLPVGRLARRQLGVPPPAEQEEITDLLDAIERRLLVAEARREETAAHLAAVSD